MNADDFPLPESITEGAAVSNDKQEGRGFTLSVKNMTPERALKAATEVEAAIGEIAIGIRKPGAVPVEAIAVLIQFVRNNTQGATE